VRKLAGWNGYLAHDVLWHLLIDFELEPAEILAGRRRMKMQLARYGKLGRPGDGLGWDDVEAVEVRRYYAELVKILEEEGIRSALED
jgi:hypothetical protein